MTNNDYITRIIQGFNNQLFKSKKIEIKDTILIIGSPRSGTTWLMEILGTISGYTYLFEPLNPMWFPGSFEVGFSSRTYLKSESNWPEGEEYLRKIFTGRIANLPIKDNPMSDIFQGFSVNNLLTHLFSNRLIVKSVNMNRMFPWISQHFHLRGIFYIIRHPCAVIASQIKTGLYGYRPSFPPYFDVFPTLENILDEVSKIDDFDLNLINKLKTIKTKEEILAAVWCLDNYIILSQPKSNHWKLVIYEKLIKEGKQEIENLFYSIGERKIPKSAFNLLKKPSSVTTKESRKFIKRSDQQLSKWKNYLSEKQIDRILKIVSDFDIDLYSKDFEPKYENLRL
ncbi:MAG: sulfotransferase domain-containing protein [Euryarchaeota archaeon]|nr:sulfotransferase domain-containing protein [Euryarchaeota archaeon]